MGLCAVWRLVQMKKAGGCGIPLAWQAAGPLALRDLRMIGSMIAFVGLVNYSREK